MIHGPSHIVGEVLGAQPTMNQAGAGAEGTGRAMAKGQPFTCVRGQGRLTLDQCLTRFLGDHPICARDCGCSLGKRAVEKMNNGEIDMPKNFKKGDCGCGKQGVQLDGEGRCYVCREEARRAAQKAARMTPAAPEDNTPPVAPAEAAPAVQEACGDDQRVGPRVEEAGEKLKAATEGLRPLANTFAALTLPESLPGEGRLVGDEDPLPDACQGWPETAGPLVIDGMEFEAFTPRRKPNLKPFLSLQSGKTFNFSPGAVRQFGILRYRFVELRYSRPGRAIAFILHEQKPDGALSLFIPKAKDRARVGAQGFMSAFNLDLKGQGPWPLKQPQPGVLVARVG